MESSNISRHIPELDGLRGIAIAIVVLWHSRPEPVSMFGPIPFLYKLLEIGPAGVDLFFVLSGFLITGILLDTKGSPDFFRFFYIRRALRILPVYFVAIAAYFWIQLPYWHSQGVNLELPAHEQVWYWSFLMNWHNAAGYIIGDLGVFWSLGVEEQFYLIWPLIVFFCAARYFPALCLGMASFSLMLRVALSTGHFIAPELLGEWIHRATITRLDTLALGALVAVVIRRPPWAQLARAWVKVAAPACFTLWVLIWLNAATLSQTLGYTLLAIGFACAVLVCVMDEGSNHPLCRIARIGVLRSMGRYSYAMYVLHFFAIYYLKVATFELVLPRMNQASLQRVPLLVYSLTALVACLAGSYLVAVVSWHLLEKHLLRLKSHFQCQLSPPKAIVATAVSTHPIADILTRDLVS